MKKTNVALRWSSITELFSRLISPLVNMLLARILAPEAFGVLATIMIVLSFAEIFVEAGFSRFLIQHEFASESEQQQHMSVAFWANVVISIVFWLAILIFRNPLAVLVGNGNLGWALVVASATLPMYGCISIQACNLKKQLNFKRLFYVRFLTALVPLVVTLPLALLGLDYWALVIGNVAGVFFQMLFLTIFGNFKPMWFFDRRILKSMAGTGVWTLTDSCVVWLTTWIDTLLISRIMQDYYLGLYKNSISTINMLFNIIIAAVTPVLFSSLSKLQHDPEKFKETFLSLQKLVCVLLLPLSFGVFLYRDFATDILFGDQWGEAANIIGVMSLALAMRIIFVRLYNEAFRAKGYFYLPLVLQLIDVVLVVPACLLSIEQGFWPLVYSRALIYLDLILPEVILAWFILKIKFKDTLLSIFPFAIGTATMMIVGYLLRTVGTGMIWNFASIVICAIVYFCTIFLFKKEREQFLRPVLNKLKRK